jgi:DNA repair exonuclease SbcCD nuclease subunit
MSTARFLHAADLHLGSPLKSLGDAIVSDALSVVQKRVNQAFDRLVQTAIDQSVDFCVFSGDIYDTAERDPGAQRRFLVGLRRLNDAGIKVFMAHGNHDPLTRDIKDGLLPPNVTVFPAGKLGVEEVTMRNGAVVTVAGVSYSKKEETENLVPLFAGLAARTIIGVLHTNVGGDSQHGNYAPSSAADLENSPVHYWALGHIHLRTVNRTNKGWWAYPGNLQGRSAKASECGPKGVLIVDVDSDGAVSEPHFVECCAVQIERADVDVSAVEEIAGLNDVIIERVEKILQASQVPVLLRIELVGQTDIKELINGKWDSSQSVEEINDVLGDGAVIKFQVSCVPRIDLVTERTRKTLLGAVLNELDQRETDVEFQSEVTNILVNVLGANR